MYPGHRFKQIYREYMRAQTRSDLKTRITELEQRIQQLRRGMREIIQTPPQCGRLMRQIAKQALEGADEISYNTSGQTSYDPER